MAEWLKPCGIETVAMESTGVYWIAPVQILEAKGIEVFLVNARFVKNAQGAQERYAGLSMDTAAAQLWPTAEVLSSRGADRCTAKLFTSPSDAGSICGEPHPAHAEGR